jgi:hypothetical protein
MSRSPPSSPVATRKSKRSHPLLNEAASRATVSSKTPPEISSGNCATRGDGTDVMIFKKYFRRKIQRKKLAFLTQNKAKLCKMLITTLVFDKSANFSPKIVKNRRKL